MALVCLLCRTTLGLRVSDYSTYVYLDDYDDAIDHLYGDIVRIVYFYRKN